MINRLFKKNYRRARLFKSYTAVALSLLVAASILGILIPNTAHATAFANVVQGYVYTRGLVRGPNGQPILVAYDESGRVVDDLGEMIEEREDAKIMSADEFNALLEAFRTFREQHKEGIARGARLVDRVTYQGSSFQTLDGKPVNKPGLANNTQSVYVRGSRTLLTPDTELVLFESPLNLTLYADGFQLPGGTKSVLVNRDGAIIEQSPYNFGYRVAYGKQGEGECNEETAVSPEDDDRLIKFYEGERPCVPLEGAQLQAYSTIVGDVYAHTKNDGRFATTILNPICPGFYFEYTNPIFLYMFYSDFNPKRKGMELFFAEPRYTYAGCNGYGFSPLFPNFAPNPVVSPNVRFPVDVIVVSGTGAISNLGVPGQSAEPLPFGDTEHETELPVFTPQIPVGLDLDADGREDKAILHEGEVYVYLGGRNIQTDDNGVPIKEDLRRLPDQLIAGGLPDTKHQGLLSQVSEEDLQQTDIYIYRVSNGKRIGELRGIKENEFRDGLLDEDGTWYYRIMLATGFNPESRQQVGWRNRAGMEDMKLEREADHLRIGENLKLIAINRKSGYIGTMTTQLKAALAGRIDFPVDEIVLRPPNLRISAERKYQVQAGLTEGEDREYIIGFEGSALTSDQYIAITTEWFDHDGTPLPGDLPGYTGRLAQLVAQNQLGNSQVGQFDVKPGRRLQLVALNGTDIQNKHYYVHVSGYPRDENPDFTTIGAGQGVLQHRPRYYVPFMVPVYNEKASRAELNAYNQARQAYEEGTINEEPLKPTPTYIRAYRPEMQFSVYELEKIKLQYEQEDGPQIIDLAQADPDEVSQALSANEYVDILYDLLASNFGSLADFGADRELLLAVGEEEMTVTVGLDNQVQFTHLDHLSLLEPEDFLTIRLYQNSDFSNVLFEYAFARLGVYPDEEIDVSADDSAAYIVALADYEDGSIVKWEIESGSGTLSSKTSELKDGAAVVQLETTNKPDDKYVVKATLKTIKTKTKSIDVNINAKTEQLTVVPGAPYEIEIEKSKDDYQSDRTDTITLIATIKDKHGNLVADGTTVGWRLDNSTSNYLSFDPFTTSGRATAVVQAPALPEDQVAFVSAGEIEESINIPVKRVVGSLSSSVQTLNIDNVQTAILTANVSAANGTPVYWTTSNGTITEQTIVTGGVAAATLSSAGGHYGPVAVTASVGDRLLSWEGEMTTSALVKAKAVHTTIVSDGDAEGVETLSFANGTTRRVRYWGATQVEVEGLANATATIALPGSNLVEAYTFESINAGIVLGAINGHPMQLNNGLLSTLKKHAGSKSVQFDGDSEGVIADHMDFQFNNSLDISLWVNPDNLSSSTLVRKDGAWKLELLSDGRLSATVITTKGSFSAVSNTAIKQDQWSYVSLQYQNSSSSFVRATVNGSSASNKNASGTLAQVSAPIIVGSGFSGYLDDLSFDRAIGDGQWVSLDGVDASGKLQLDASGRGSFVVRSRGASITGGPSKSLPIRVTSSALQASNGFSLISSANAQETEEAVAYIQVAERTWWTYTYDAVSSFFGADPETGVGIASNIAGGMLIVGDVGSLVKNLWRTTPWAEKDPSVVEVVFSGMGLATEVAVGAGEMADAPITTVRALVAFLGDTPFTQILVTRLKNKILNGVEHVGESALFNILKNADEIAIQFANRVLTSEQLYKNMIDLMAKMGDEIFHASVVIASSPQIGIEATQKVIQTLGRVSDNVLTRLKSALPMSSWLPGLGKAVRYGARFGIDPELMARILDNRFLFLDSAYTEAQLLKDMDLLVGKTGFAELVNLLKINAIQVKGFRFELEAAADLIRKGVFQDVIEFGKRVSEDVIEALGKTDIDYIARLADGSVVFVQAKRSSEAFTSLDKTQAWVRKALMELGTDDYSKIKYVVPEGVTIPPKILAWFNDPEVGIEVIRATHL